MEGIRMEPRGAESMSGQAAVSDLFAEHYRGLVRYAYLLCGSQPTAEDIVQDAFAKLLTSWDRIAEKERALGYVKVTIANLSKSRFRRLDVKRRAAALLRPALEVEAPAADFGVIRSEEVRRLVSAVNDLPTRQRQVIVLRYWGEMSESEIASALNVSAGTVKSTAARARTTLAATFTAEEQS